MAFKLLFLFLVCTQGFFFNKEEVLVARSIYMKQDAEQPGDFCFYVGANNHIMFQLDTLSKEELFEAIYQHVLKFGTSHQLFFHTFPQTDYAFYVDIQNQINQIYKRLRNEKALESYHLLYNQLSDEQKGVIKKCVPFRLYHKLETDG